MYNKNNARPKFGANRSRFDHRFSRNRNTGARRPSPRRGFSETIDVSKFINKSVAKTEVIEPQIKNSFSDFNFCDALRLNLRKRNYTTPTPIQDQAIGSISNGRDLIGLANTGTGKTAAFLLPLIDKVYRNRNEKVLIVAPTRELAQQIEQEFRQFSWDMKIFSAICVGGAPIYKQISNLKRDPNFIIGTPGRLKDLGNRSLIRFDKINNIVLDEVDRMLDMGFIDEIKTMLSGMPENRQSLFFSATLPPKIRDLTGQFLKDPVVIEVKSGTTANVDQDVVRVRDKNDKLFALKEMLKNPEFSKVLIFSETKRDVERLTADLSNGGFKAESIHGDKRQSQRQRALGQFKNDEINILVATDVAARGLDIKDVTHVINYTIPQTYHDYVHRIGRTGRCGNTGKALTFIGA